MQRWILLTVVALALVFAAGGAAAWHYRQGRPAPMWVPLPLNPELPESRREPLAEQMHRELTRPETLAAIARELDLAAEWDLPTAEAAATELGRRVFVEIGEMISPIGARMPSVNVGVRGSRREQPLTGRIATRLMTDVQKVIGEDH